MTDLDPEYDAADVNTIDDDDAGAGADEDELAPTAVSVLDLLVCSLVDDPDSVG